MKVLKKVSYKDQIWYEVEDAPTTKDKSSVEEVCKAFRGSGAANSESNHSQHTASETDSVGFQNTLLKGV